MKKICVIGLGYIGLPTAAMFATHGFKVLGVDLKEQVVEILNNGDVHIREAGLKTLAQAAVKSGNLIASLKPDYADAFIIAVPTPFTKEDKKGDLSYVISAAESIFPLLQPGNLVILESTVPPRTTEDILVPILERSGLLVSRGEKQNGKLVYLAHCPERVLPGRILTELVSNDRVIGGIDREAANMAKMLYDSFVEGEIFLTDATTAEMVKLMENTYRDVNIALANELAQVAEKVGINIWEAIEIANRHPRVNILKPGPGVGGHCIAVDPWFIVQSAPELTPLIQTTRRVNDSMPDYVAKMVKEAVTDVKRPVIACLGLTYKGDVDDIRESPAIKVIELLRAEGFELRAYDPFVPMNVIPEQVPTIEAALSGVDAVLILTDHTAFRELRLDNINCPVIDPRNVLAIDSQACSIFHRKGNR
jgi:UDP-N-acetyl-D-mannosaminuronic acid dehydrogenase